MICFFSGYLPIAYSESCFDALYKLGLLVVSTTIEYVFAVFRQWIEVNCGYTTFLESFLDYLHMPYGFMSYLVGDFDAFMVFGYIIDQLVDEIRFIDVFFRTIIVYLPSAVVVDMPIEATVLEGFKLFLSSDFRATASTFEDTFEGEVLGTPLGFIW